MGGLFQLIVNSNLNHPFYWEQIEKLGKITQERTQQNLLLNGIRKLPWQWRETDSGERNPRGEPGTW